MPATALSMGPPLRRTPTIRPLRSWHCVIENRTQLCKAPSSTWSVLLQLLRRHGVSLGRFLRWPHTVGRLLRFPVRLPPLPDLSSTEDTSTLALVCLALDYTRALSAFGVAQ